MTFASEEFIFVYTKMSDKPQKEVYNEIGNVQMDLYIFHAESLRTYKKDDDLNELYVKFKLPPIPENDIPRLCRLERKGEASWKKFWSC